MLVSTFILLLEAAIKPQVTLTPNWENILVGDSTTLTCNVPSTAQKNPRTYKWFKDQTPMKDVQQTLQIPHSSLQDRGDYQCQADGGDISDPVTLHVLERYLILQRPPSIFEGDDLTLRCRHANGLYALNPKFYKDDIELPPSTISHNMYPEIHIQVNIDSAGRYSCNTSVIHEEQYSKNDLSDAFKAIVKELFSPPEIKVTPYRVIEGGDMTVTCDTRLDPLRANTELRFAFYKDGRPVQEFDASDSYRVRSAQLEDSGNYTCDVMTASDTVRKASVGFYVQISQLQVFSPGTLPVVIVGSLLIVIISAVLLWKYRNNWRSCPYPCQRHRQPTTRTVANADPDPQDICYTYLDISRLPKGNKVKKDELTVTYATVMCSDIQEQRARPRIEGADSGTIPA